MESEYLAKILGKIVNFLSYKPRSQAEVEQRLDSYIRKEKNLLPSEYGNIKRSVMDKLGEGGYINDLDFSLQYVASAINSPSPKSIKFIENFLYKKGVSKEIVNTVLLSLSPDEADVAAKIATKKWRILSKDPKTPTFEKKKKLLSFLIQKGFTDGAAKRAVDTIGQVK